MKPNARVLRLCAALLLLSTGEQAFAATCTWQGGVDTKWSTAGNWTGCGAHAPQNGDSLTFPVTATTFTSQNDIASLTPAAVLISSPRYVITGNGISLPAGGAALQFNGSFTMNFPGASFLLPITLTGTITVSDISADGTQLTLGAINLNGNQLTFDTSLDTIHIAGAISGNGTIVKVGIGVLRLEADSTFTGHLGINRGIVVATTAHGLGASGAGNETLIANNGVLDFAPAGDLIVDEPIVFTAGAGEVAAVTGHKVTLTSSITGPSDPAFINGLEADGTSDQLMLTGPVRGAKFLAEGHGLITFANATNSWSTLNMDTVTVRVGAIGGLPATALVSMDNATLDLNGFDATIGGLAANGGFILLGAKNLTVNVAGPQMLFASAGITGSGTFTKTGDGTLQLSDLSNTVFLGTLTVSAGDLRLANAAKQNVFAGPIVINGGTLNLYDDNQIGDQSPVTINSPGVLVMNDHLDVVGSLAGSGNVSLGEGRLIAGGNNTSTTFSGLLISSNTNPQGLPFAKDGTGTMTLTGQNAYIGETAVDHGTLVVNGTLSSTGTVIIGDSTIAGTGSIGNIVGQNGVISPGNSPGILHAGMAHINPMTQLDIDLNGPALGSGYDQLDVAGDVVLSPGCLLNVTRRFAAAQGETFTIINVGAGHTLTGTFSGLAEGATLDLGGQHFSITYKGGDGNDVVLTSLDHAPAITYYLSEGATGAFFDEDVLIANPNLSAAPVTLTFSKEDGSQVTSTQTIPAQSRATVHVDTIPGLAATAASTQVRSEQGLALVVERTMFWDQSHYAGSTGSAVDQPAQDWFFAEGSQGFFNTFVLVINPNATPTDVTFTFLRESDTPVTKTITVGANTRLTLDAGTVPEIVNRSFGINVHGTQPIMAERSMYFGTTPTRLWSGGTESAGVTALSTHWFLAEGATGGFFDTFILVSNPNSVAANVTFQYLLDTGDTIPVQKVVAPNARLTTNIETESDTRLHNAAVSTVVTSDQPIIAERSMYWPGAAVPWGEGHNSFGVVDAGLHWGLAEGRTGGPFNFHTYILLANPQLNAANVTVTFLRENGAAIVTKTFTVPPTSRFNIDAGTITELQNESFGADIQVTNNVPIIVERSMYWDSNGFQFSGGTNATGSRLP